MQMSSVFEPLGTIPLEQCANDAVLYKIGDFRVLIIQSDADNVRCRTLGSLAV